MDREVSSAPASPGRAARLRTAQETALSATPPSPHAGPLSLFLLVPLDLLCMKVSVRSFGFLLSQNALSLRHEEASGDNDRLLGRSVFKILRLHKRPGGEVLQL